MSASSSLRTILLVVLAVFPWPLKRLGYRWLFGWRIEPGAWVGISVITARHVHLGRGARIGHFTVVRNLPELRLGEQAVIGQWNWIACGEHFTSGQALLPPPREQGLFMSPFSSITSRHYLDCPGGIFVGEYSVIAGVRSSLFTHDVDFDASAMRCKPIRIGKYCYIGSNVKLTPGSCVPDYCVVGIGTVVAGSLPDERTVYAGVPARPIRSIGEGEFFRRENPRGL